MSRFTKDVAVEALEADADHSAKRGFLVKLTSGKATLNNSATAEAYGVILDGETQGGMDSVGVLGGNLGTVKLKAGGTITKGQRLKQKSDGSVEADNGTGARVVVGKAMEGAAVDELFEAIVFLPIIYTS